MDAYAKELAQDFVRICPITAKEFLSGKDGDKKNQQTLTDMFDRAKTFRQEHRLGIFKRARFAKRFQDELRNQGYAPSLVNQITTALVANALTGH